MEAGELIERVMSASEPASNRDLLLEHMPILDTEAQTAVMEALKKRADELMRTNIQQCLQQADLMSELSSRLGNPAHQALSLLARANAYTIVMGEHRQGLACYEQAAEIYAGLGNVVKQAQSQIGKIFALSNLGRFDEAIAAGEWAGKVFQEHQEWFNLARLKVNMGTIYSRLGKDMEALEMFDEAKAAYQQLGIEGHPHWLRVELNRAVVLRNLGRFPEAIQASQRAMESHKQLGQAVAAARAQQTLANTYYLLGRYNEALAMLDEAKDVLLQDKRIRHAMLVELYISDCLLQLRRFNEVLEKTRQARSLFSQLETYHEVGQAILNEAGAYAGLELYAEALASLAEARQLFNQEGNQVAVAEVDLQAAVVTLSENQTEKAFTQAQSCAQVFENYNLPVWQARANLVGARAALALERYAQAQALVDQALKAGEEQQLATLTYPSRHLLGQLLIRQGDAKAGLEALDQAIQDLERLYGRLMVEFRANFVEDKQRVYEDAVDLCINLNRPGAAVEYVERAKSRALLDLLAHRLDLSITAHNDSDRPLVDELQRLRVQRDQLYRRWEGGEGFGQRGETESFSQTYGGNEPRVIAIEKQITDLWHKLLIRNADYASQAALWQVRSEPFQQYLENGEVLVEYFAIQNRLVVFLATNESIKVQRLPVELEQIQKLVQLLWLNLKSTPRSAKERLPALKQNAQGICQKLYQLLVEPVERDLQLAQNLIIVPFNTLHYLPFAALYDGQQYLIEKFPISYLPGASVLKHCRERHPSGGDLVAVGNSFKGNLPFAAEEAAAIAELWSGTAILEDRATLAEVRQAAAKSRVLHLATHGDFRPDNPLFSGLGLADGWLTTLDIFSMHIESSLVTLSACQTGRNVIGGGDELLGLMRSFLAAGAASLVATLWAVEDRSTAKLMRSFYKGLTEGIRKNEALRQAQIELFSEQDAQDDTSHPYFWAPFFLVGDPGVLSR